MCLMIAVCLVSDYRLRGLKQDTGGLKGDIDELKRDTGELKRDIDELKRDTGELQRDIDELKRDTSELQRDMAHLSKSVWRGFKILSGSYAYKLAEMARLQFVADFVTGPNTGIRMTGSGSMVDFHGHCFIGTVAHNLAELNASWNASVYFPMKGFVPILKTGGFYANNDFDVALIPFRCDPKIPGLKVKNTTLKLGKQLWGIASLDAQAYALHCRVVEKRRNKAIIMADCGGSFGASGTALLNGKGKMIGLHRGSLYYPHGSQIPEDNDLDSLFMSLNETCKVNASTFLLPEKCLRNLRSAITISSRNPCSQVVPAHYLFDLLNNVTLGIEPLRILQ
jgi:FtsZ-binding cell division protein ZapB